MTDNKRKGLRTVLFILFMLAFIMLIPNAFASDIGTELFNNTLANYHLNDSTDTLGTYDLSDIGSPAYTTGVFGNAFSGDGNDALQDTTWINTVDAYDSGLTFTGWFKMDGNPADYSAIFTVQASGSYGKKMLEIAPDGTMYLRMGDGNSGTTPHAGINAGTITDNNWHSFVLTHSTTSNELYVDCDKKLNWVSTGAIVNADDLFYIGQEDTSTRFFDGLIDEITVLSLYSNQSHVNHLCNSSLRSAFYPFIKEPPPPPTLGNNSIERLNIVRQVGTTTLTDNNYNLITSGTFELEKNASFYGGFDLTLLSNVNNNISCIVKVDGNNVSDEIKRTNTANVVGSMYIPTILGMAENGTHTASLECKKSGSGNIAIGFTIGAGHALLNSKVINFQNHTINKQINTTTFIKIKDINFTTSINQSQENKTLVIDWGANYIFNSTNTIETYFTIDGDHCSHYPRYGATGNIGSLSGDCYKSGLINNTEYNIELYAKGNGIINIDTFIVKEFSFPLNYIGSILLNNTAVNINTKIGEVNISHSESIDSNIFVKAGIPHKTNGGSLLTSFYFKIINTDTGANVFNSSNDYRTTSTNTGVTILIDSYIKAPVGNYTIELYGNCGGVGCSIDGGEMITYITHDLPFGTNAFYVNAQHAYNSTPILDFNVTLRGITFLSNASGYAELFTNELLVDFNVSDGIWYDVLTVTNHNPSTNYTANLVPKYYAFNSYTDATNYIESQNILVYLNTTNSTFATVNAWAVFNGTRYNMAYQPTLGLYAVSIPSGLIMNNSKTLNFTIQSYYNVTNSIDTFLFNKQSNISLFQMFIENCSATPFGIRYNLFDEATNLATNGDMEMTTRLWFLNPSLYREYSFDITNVSTQKFCIYPNWATLKYYSQTFYNSDYSIYRDYYLNNITITNSSNYDVNLYLLNATDSTEVFISVFDQNSNEVEGAFIKIQRWDISTNTFRTVEILRTSNEGKATAHMILDDAYYKFIVEYNNEVYLETTAERISTTTKILYINTEQTILLGQSTASNLNFDPITWTTLNSTHGYFRFVYSDPTNLITEGCLIVQEQSYSLPTVCSVCEGSASATLICTLEYDSTKSYMAKARIHTNTDHSWFTIDTAELVFGSFADLLGKDGIWVQILLTISFVLVGMWHPIVAVGLGMFAFGLLGFIGIGVGSWYIFITLIVIFVGMIFKGRG